MVKKKQTNTLPMKKSATKQVLHPSLTAHGTRIRPRLARAGELILKKQLLQNILPLHTCLIHKTHSWLSISLFPASLLPFPSGPRQVEPLFIPNIATLYQDHLNETNAWKMNLSFLVASTTRMYTNFFDILQGKGTRYYFIIFASLSR